MGLTVVDEPQTRTNDLFMDAQAISQCYIHRLLGCPMFWGQEHVRIKLGWDKVKRRTNLRTHHVFDLTVKLCPNYLILVRAIVVTNNC